MAKTRTLVAPWTALLLLLHVVHPLKTIATKTATDTLFHLEMLQEVLRSLLSGWDLVLYLDPDMDVIARVQLVTSPAFQDSPHILVDLGSSGAPWSLNQPAAVLRGANLIHVVVFQEDPRPFFESVSLQWNPKYLILFSLSLNKFQHLLRAEVFKGPENLVLFQRQSSENISTAPVPEMYTCFPFSKENPISSLGLWNSSVFVSLEDIFRDRFPSFNGYKFWLGTWFDDYPYLHQSQLEPEGVGDGVEVEMLDALATTLNFTYHLTTQPPDLNWGDYENGSWTGMLGMVHSGDKNFTVNYFGFTNERIEAFDASVSYWNEGFGLALLAPPPLPKWRSVYYPFTLLVWVSLISTFILAVIIMILQEWAEVEPFLGGVGRTWAYLLRPVVGHSLPALPTAHWQRVFVGTWWLYCFILTTAYTANLIAFLTIPVFPERIQTVQQLAQSDYRVSMYDYGEFVPAALKSSEDPFYRTLGERLDLYSTDDESMYPVLNGTHAYIESYSYSIVYIFDVYQVKNAYMLREQLYPGHLCWYFQKNTAWKYKFDQGIQRLVEAGLIQHWLKVKTEDFLGVDYERKQKEGSEERIIPALSLEHVQGIFFLLVLGWSLSTLVFLLEILAHASAKAR